MVASSTDAGARREWLVVVGPDIGLAPVVQAALVDVGVSNPDDPITDFIAKAIVNVIANGERNPEVVAERALNALGVRKSSAA